MARTFTKAAGTAMYLNALPPGGIATPFSMSAWIRATALTGGGVVMCVGMDETYLGNVGSGDFWRLNMNATGTIQAQVGVGGSGISCNTLAGMTANVWVHVAASFISATSRAVWLNGGSKGTNATNRAPSIYNSVWIGGYDNTFPGAIANVGIWNNYSLTDDDVLVLSKGFVPKTVAPTKLVFDMKLIGQYYPETDSRGGLVVPYQGGTPVGRLDHPRTLNGVPPHDAPCIIAPPTGGFPFHSGEMFTGGFSQLGF